jgi:hypothetical protein
VAKRRVRAYWNRKGKGRTPPRVSVEEGGRPQAT